MSGFISETIKDRVIVTPIASSGHCDSQTSQNNIDTLVTYGITLCVTFDFPLYSSCVITTTIATVLVRVLAEVLHSRRNLHRKHLPIECHGKMLMMQALRLGAFTHVHDEWRSSSSAAVHSCRRRYRNLVDWLIGWLIDPATWRWCHSHLIAASRSQVVVSVSVACLETHLTQCQC